METEAVRLNWPMGVRALAMLAIPLSALAALSVSIGAFQSDQWLAAAELRHISQRRTACAELLAEILQAETTLFQYLLQGDKAHFGPYKIALDKIPYILHRLSAISANNRDRDQQLAKVRSLVNQYMESLWKLRSFAAIPNLSPANPTEQLLTSNGELLALIRFQLEQLNQEETRRFDRVFERADEARTRTEGTVLITVILGVFGGITAQRSQS